MPHFLAPTHTLKPMGAYPPFGLRLTLKAVFNHLLSNVGDDGARTRPSADSTGA